jgi:hypothetical protein
MKNLSPRQEEIKALLGKAPQSFGAIENFYAKKYAFKSALGTLESINKVAPLFKGRGGPRGGLRYAAAGAIWRNRRSAPSIKIEGVDLTLFCRNLRQFKKLSQISDDGIVEVGEVFWAPMGPRTFGPVLPPRVRAERLAKLIGLPPQWVEDFMNYFNK